ncbi:hypothetical protein [Mesorhizobium sp. J428]|uniref:hypothetical protein n=1 Tax=Mesorhizobium sp. J428 TaxID=2898440 RepID=UPI0021512FBB|nr:hypothetical protein [Mesorhizobium sp. J428]MCR5859719.1 hypothetical protein [Mesorhizobium sp. J428]
MKTNLLFAGALAFALVAVAVHTISPGADIFSLMPDAGFATAMATLAVNKQRDYQMGDKEEYPVIAADIIYQGAAVGENASGYARPLVAADPFLGFAEAIADNSAGAAGAININVKKRGNIVLPISGLAITANDRPAVYASDDDTFTLTSAGNSLIGYVSRWVSTGVAVVEFDAALVKAALQA